MNRKWKNIKDWIHGTLVYKKITTRKRRKVGHKDWWTGTVPEEKGR